MTKKRSHYVGVFCYTVCMLSWSTKRKLMYSGAIFLIIILVCVLVFFRFFYHTPTCSDGIKNGSETGVDCGGACQNICTIDTLPPVVYWAKAFHIAGDAYSVAAYVQNPNIDATNQNAEYEFRIFDDQNILIGARTGEMSIPKNKKFVVFESGFNIPNRTPKYVQFDFTSLGSWQKDTTTPPDIAVSYSPLSATTTTPTISGIVTNQSGTDIAELELVVVISDSNQNAIAVSRTLVDNLAKHTSQNFVFNWPAPFAPNTASAILVTYRVVQ